jgi:hypothetical protein
VRFWLENLRVHRERLERFGVFRDSSERRAALDQGDQVGVSHEGLLERSESIRR